MMLTPISAKPAYFNRPASSQARPRFMGKDSSPHVQDMASLSVSSLVQKALSQALSEDFINELLKKVDSQKILKTVLTPENVQELVAHSNVRDITKQELGTLLTKEYLQELLETTQAKKLIKETLNPEYIREIADNANLKSFTKDQIKTLLNDQELQRETRQTIKKNLSLLIQDALHPLLQMSAGMAAVALSQRQTDENLKAGLMAGGSHQLTQGSHKLLGLQQAPTSQMALGATSILASQFLLPAHWQEAANLFGAMSLTTGVLGQIANRQQEGSDWHHFLRGENWLEAVKNLPGLGHLAHFAENWINQRKTPRLSIIEAAQQGDLKAIERWLDLQADFNEPNPKGQTPLSLAAANGHVEIVDQLLSLPKIEPNHDDQNGRTALHHAVLNHQLEIAEALLEHEKTDPNHRDKQGQTPLHLAAIQGSQQLIKALLAKEKTNALLTDKDRLTPYMHALKQEQLDACIQLVAREPKVIQAKTMLQQDSKQAENAFRDAAQYGNLEDVQAFAFAGIDLNATPTRNGKTALYLAAENGHTAIAKFLIQANADILKPSLYRWTPLDIARIKKHHEIVRVLTEAEAELNNKKLASPTPSSDIETYPSDVD